MTYRKVNMIGPVRAAMAGVMSSRSNPSYQLKSIEQTRPGLALVTLDWPLEKYWVCLFLDLAVIYGESVIRERLESPDNFDGAWLLRFVPGEFENHLEQNPSEVAKHRTVKDLGIDIEAAARSFRAGCRDLGEWIEAVWEAYSFSFRSFGKVVCWRVS